MKDTKDPRGITLEPEAPTFDPVLLAPGIYGATHTFAGRRLYFAIGDGDILDVRVQRNGETEDDVIAAIWLANDAAIQAAKSRTARHGLRLVLGGLIS